MKEQKKYQALLYLCTSMVALAVIALWRPVVGNKISAEIIMAIVAIEAVAIVIIYFQKTEKNKQ